MQVQMYKYSANHTTLIILRSVHAAALSEAVQQLQDKMFMFSRATEKDNNQEAYRKYSKTKQTRIKFSS